MSDKKKEEKEKVVAAEDTSNTKSQEKTSTNDVQETKDDQATTSENEVVSETSNLEEKTEVVSVNEEETSEDEEDQMSSSDDEDTDHEDEEEAIDYSQLSTENLIASFKKLVAEKPVQSIKTAAEEIRSEFFSRFNEELTQKKEEFIANGGNIIDFHYTTPIKKEFSSLYFDYKEKRNRYYQNLKKDLQANLAKRQELIEELKSLLSIEENINSTYKHFKEIQEKWHSAGPIPRDKYNLVWNTYRHHVENFYDFLHLNREFRDLDFKHNLDQKLKLITRVEELAQEEDINKAFRELQTLHKIWKEDIGPVAKEFRDKVWDQFSAATKVIHDKRQLYLEELEKEFVLNFNKKKELIRQISETTENTKSNHRAWQNAIKKVQELRDEYFEIGKVPRNQTKDIWDLFKEATRSFNRTKNAFYKNQKKEQYTNLEKKLELVKIAEENKDNDDLEVTIPLMKKIQQDWKKIGHVPRKESDKIWKQFKDACNHFFDRLHAQKAETNNEELANFEAKRNLLEEVSKLKLSGETENDVALIKEKINTWKGIGRVPFNKKRIDKDFNKVLDNLFEKLNLSKKEAEMIRFENKLNTMVSQEDNRKLDNELFFIRKKVTEIKSEINQLENNLGFFQHADDKNPLVQEVHKNIAKQKEQLEVWKAKLKKIKSVRNS